MRKVITVFVFHKSNKGQFYPHNEGYSKKGDPIPDLTKVFNSWNDAHEYACSYECVRDRQTGQLSSSWDQYIKSYQLTIDTP